MAKEKNKDDMQKKYLELQIIVNQISQLQQQILAIQQQVLELRNLKENLDKFKDVKIGTETYIPLGGNIFTKAKLQDNKEFLVSVGANILVTKTLEETINLVEKQSEEIEKVVFELESQINNLDLKGQEIQQELVNLSNKQ